jgi:hypothetical protein
MGNIELKSLEFFNYRAGKVVTITPYKHYFLLSRSM